MNIRRTLVLVLCSIIAAAASAQTPSPMQQAMRGSLYGKGMGLASAAVIGMRPDRVEPFVRESGEVSEFEKQYFQAQGLRMMVLKSAISGTALPISVEVSTPETLRLIEKDWSGLSRASIIANYGAPDEQSVDSMRYDGLAQNCSDSIHIRLKHDKPVSLTWRFCVD